MYLNHAIPDGLYGFLDIGAGTVDASIFRLTGKAGERSIPTYDGKVIQAGAAFLESIAARMLANQVQIFFESYKERQRPPDPFIQEPEEAKYLWNLSSNWVENEVLKGLRILLGEASRKEKDVGRWSDIQVFLGGGGMAIPLYSSATREAFKNLNRNLKIETLSKPDDFEMRPIHPDFFHRFAVAYGLSFNVVNLPDYKMPSEVTDLSPEQIHPEKKLQRAMPDSREVDW